MVEGIAEALPTACANQDRRRQPEGVGCDSAERGWDQLQCVHSLFGTERLGVPVVILTDGDAKVVGGEMSATASGLREQAADIPNLSVEMSEITFEHELARSEMLLPYMVSALKELHPNIGATLETELEALATIEEKAAKLLGAFSEKSVSKGRFAQELAEILEECNLGANAVPDYIRNALRHLGVLNEVVNDGHG